MIRLYRNPSLDCHSNIPPTASLAPYFHACDLFAFPSMIPSETFGLVQLEAMACGKPVINTDMHPGVSGVGLDGITGTTVPKEDSAAFRAAIRKLLGNPALRAEMGNRAKLRAQHEFSMERFISRIAAEIL